MPTALYPSEMRGTISDQVPMSDPPRKVVDCVLFNGETKMLLFRLTELNDLVDHFIIAEAEYTFTGQRKATVFDQEQALFARFKPKVTYLRNANPPKTDAWENETDQRNFLANGVRPLGLGSDDILMLSDVDEIPDPAMLKDFKENGCFGIYVFYQNFYYYNTRCRSKAKWCGTLAGNYATWDHHGLDFETLRRNRWRTARIGRDHDYRSGGWHFSFFGDTGAIIRKIQSFAHQEFNKPEFLDPARIERVIAEGKDLFDRPNEGWELIDDRSYLPKHVAILEGS